jgi:hypothetical protein
MPRTVDRAVKRRPRVPNAIHRKIALRKRLRKVGQPKFVITEYTDAKQSS